MEIVFPSAIPVLLYFITLDNEIISSASGDDNRRCCIVVRAAEDGCLVVRSMVETEGRGGDGEVQVAMKWLPAYYPTDSESVIDPTGAGNAFLGG